MKAPTRGPTKFPRDGLAIPSTLILEAPAVTPVLFYFMYYRISAICQSRDRWPGGESLRIAVISDRRWGRRNGARA